MILPETTTQPLPLTATIVPVELSPETEAWLAQLDDRWPRWNERCEIVDYWSERMWCRTFCFAFHARVVE